MKHAGCYYCEMSTAGKHEVGCPLHNTDITVDDASSGGGMGKGWECPSCGRGNAPWRAECPCHRQANVSSDQTTPRGPWTDFDNQ